MSSILNPKSWVWMHFHSTLSPFLSLSIYSLSLSLSIHSLFIPFFSFPQNTLYLINNHSLINTQQCGITSLTRINEANEKQMDLNESNNRIYWLDKNIQGERIPSFLPFSLSLFLLLLLLSLKLLINEIHYLFSFLCLLTSLNFLSSCSSFQNFNLIFEIFHSRLSSLFKLKIHKL